MKILKKKKKKKIFFFFFFLDLGFFFKLGKKTPKSHWERSRISAPEDTKKNPWCSCVILSFHHSVMGFSVIVTFPGQTLVLRSVKSQRQ